MPINDLIRLTIDVRDPELDDEEVEQFTQHLVRELNDVDGVEQVSLVADPNPPDDSKSFGSFIIGLLTTEISLEGAKTAFALLQERVGNRPIEIEVQANGKTLKVKAANYKDLEKSIEAAQKFISA